MAETLQVPGIKKPLPKWAVFGGIGVVGLLVFQYYKSRKSASATAAAAGAATSTDQFPPDGTVGNPQDPYSTDPATGQTYGNESVGSGGTFGAFTGGGGVSGGAPGGDSSTGPTGPPFSNNADWTNWVIQQMQTNDPGLDVGALTNALGLYLNGQPVDAAQKTLVFDAIAVAGDPPVAGANGYPPKVQTNGGTTGGHLVQNLRVTNRGRDYLNIAWTAIAGIGKYEVHIYQGNRELKSATAGTNKYRATGLSRSTTYHIYVRANNGPAGSGISATTLK